MTGVLIKRRQLDRCVSGDNDETDTWGKDDHLQNKERDLGRDPSLAADGGNQLHQHLDLWLSEL